MDKRPSCKFLDCISGMGLAARGTCAWGDPDNPNCPGFEDTEVFLNERKAEHEKTKEANQSREKEKI